MNGDFVLGYYLFGRHARYHNLYVFVNSGGDLNLFLKKIHSALDLSVFIVVRFNTLKRPVAVASRQNLTHFKVL